MGEGLCGKERDRFGKLGLWGMLGLGLDCFFNDFWIFFP
jgi:hypothetical protein